MARSFDLIMGKAVRQYKAKLQRTLSFPSLFFTVAASMVGTGIFTTSGFIMRDVENPWAMLLCWVLGGFIALSGALCYGELGAMFPEAGGDYVFLRESFGKRAAFLSGWVSLWVGFSAPIAATAIAFGKYCTVLLPSNVVSVHTPIFLALLSIILFTWLHAQGLAIGVGVQNVITFLKVVLIFFLVGFGLTVGKGSYTHFDAAFDYSFIFSEKFSVSLIFVSFAYSGWNAAAYLGSEAEKAERNIPLSIIAGTLFVMGMYVLLNILYVYAIPAREMYAVEKIGGLAAERLFGKNAGFIFAALIAFGLLSTLSSMIISGPRVYYAMARNKLFIRMCGTVDKSSRVPRFSVILQGIVAAILTLTSTFYTLLVYSGFVLAVFSALTVAGMMFLRFKRPDLRRPYNAFGYPWPPIVFISMNVWIVVFSVRNNLETFFWGAGTVAAGLIVYEYFNRRAKTIGKVFKTSRYLSMFE
ncbi:MAG: amino acid permease [Candidatus Omnitrophica bacterium]|nr:amino acid permease [Candidatus Omnitrophota bacterium]